MIYRTHLSTSIAIASIGLYTNYRIHEIIPPSPEGIDKTVSIVNNYIATFFWHADWQYYNSLPWAIGKIYILVFLFGVAFGALTPDIDHPNSKLGRYMPKFISTNIPHRGPTHSLFAIVLLTILGMFVFNASVEPTSFFSAYSNPLSHTMSGWLLHIYAGFIIGYLLHILEDYFSIDSIHLFYPIGKNKRTRWSPFRYRTGGFTEKIIFYVTSLFAIYSVIVWLTNQPILFKAILN